MNRAEAYIKILDRIAEACYKSARKPENIELVAVSKTFPQDAIKEVYDAGSRCFGESKAQEFRDKSPNLPNDIKWHFIGHLQKNKIKYVVPKAELIHSIDSLVLAEALSSYAVKNNIEISALVEVNTSSEESKFGFSIEQTKEMYLRIAELPRIITRGLMTIASFTSDERNVRRSFCKLRELKEIVAHHLPEGTTEVLSMGMSHDFQWAIEEGSTMVRVGSAIFGPRGR